MPDDDTVGGSTTMSSEESAQPGVRFSDSAPQLLATEHWSLLAGRSAEWNEAFARTGLFLNVLSAAAVALALVADATAFGEGFRIFALVLFPLVLFLGLATYFRLIQINLQDLYYVAAMNRLRQAYVRIDPQLTPYFTAGIHDDYPGVFTTFTLGSPGTDHPALQFLVTTPTVVATIDSIIAAAGTALVASRNGVAGDTLVVVAAIAFAAAWLALFSVQLQQLARVRRVYTPRFPGPGDGRTFGRPQRTD
jgi:hypothetical protein